MSIATRIEAVAAPVLSELELSLYDLEVRGSVVRITVDAPGGANLDVIAKATRQISRALDEADPFPDTYTLEVSSPGLERVLRLPHHYASAVGSTVKVKVRGPQGTERLEGTLTGATDAEIELTLDDPPGELRSVAIADIERARTTFAWGPAPKPGQNVGAPNPASAPSAGRPATGARAAGAEPNEVES